jgi:hypothetical protein
MTNEALPGGPAEEEKLNRLRRRMLPRGTAYVEAVDARGSVVSSCSGFLRQVDGAVYLYSAWHLLTGIDPFHVVVPHQPRCVASLHITAQANTPRGEGISAVGGRQTIEVSLFDADGPKWEQDERSRDDQADLLEPMGMQVPFWHDAFRILVPLEFDALLHVPQHANVPQHGDVSVGDRVLFAGYPYGFSVTGPNQPTAIVLTRGVAATESISRGQRELLLDGIGSPVMSGGPVFAFRNELIELLGIYAGQLMPERGSAWVGAAYKGNGKGDVTALGRCCDLRLHLWGGLPFVPPRVFLRP